MFNRNLTRLISVLGVWALATWIGGVWGGHGWTVRAQETSDSPPVQLGLPYVQPVYGDELLSPHFYLTDGLEFSLRSGALFPLGQGTLERRVDAAWQFEASVIQPVKIHPNGWECFWELGAGYIQWEGDTGRLITSGIFQQSVFSPPQFFENFQSTRLVRIIHRYGFASVGASWPVPMPHGTWRLTARVGSRLGSAKGKFENRPTADLQNAVDDAISGGADPGQFIFNSDVNTSDISIGLFVNVGLSAWIPDVWLGAWHLGDVAIGAEVGFAHDWIDFGDFNRSDNGIGSVGTLLTIGLYH